MPARARGAGNKDGREANAGAVGASLGFREAEQSGAASAGATKLMQAFAETMGKLGGFEKRLCRHCSSSGCRNSCVGILKERHGGGGVVERWKAEKAGSGGGASIAPASLGDGGVRRIRIAPARASQLVQAPRRQSSVL